MNAFRFPKAAGNGGFFDANMLFFMSRVKI